MLLCVPIALVLVTVNYKVDPGGKYSKANFYKTVTEQLAKGKNIVITEKFHNYLGPKLIMNLLQNQKKANEITLIGSSRIMPVSAEMVHEENFMNYGVHGAHLGDLIGMYELLRQKDILPKKLIIDLSPLIFMYDHNPKPAFKEAFEAFISRTSGKAKADLKKESFLELAKDKFDYYSELLSPRYFQQSIKFLGKDDSDKKDVHSKFKFAQGKEKNDPKVISYDNSRFKEIRNNIDPATKIFNAKSKITKEIFGTTLDVNKTTSQIFIQWLNDMNKTDMEIVFLVLPFDPYFYDEEIKTFGKQNVLFKTDNYLSAVNKKFKNRYKIIGTTNPKSWGINYEDTGSYYYDYAHLTSYGTARLLSRVAYFN